MRILAAYYTHKPGGFCRRLYRLLNALAAAGHEVIYLSLDPNLARLSSKVRAEKIPFPLSSRRGLIFWACFTLWLPIYLGWRALWLKPDRLLAFGSYYSRAFRFAKHVSKAELVLFVRSLVFEIDRITGKPAWLRRFTERVIRFFKT